MSSPALDRSNQPGSRIPKPAAAGPDQANAPLRDVDRPLYAQILPPNGLGNAVRAANDPASIIAAAPPGEHKHVHFTDPAQRRLALYVTKTPSDRYILEPDLLHAATPTCAVRVKTPEDRQFKLVQGRIAVPPGTLVQVGSSEPFSLPPIVAPRDRRPPNVRQIEDAWKLQPGEVVVMGRSRGCDIHIPDAACITSSEHARLERLPNGSYKLSDGANGKLSRNGTYYKQGTSWIKVIHEAELLPGTTLRCGINGPELRLPGGAVQSVSQNFGSRRWYGPKATALVAAKRQAAGEFGFSDIRVIVQTATSGPLATDIPVIGATLSDGRKLSEVLQTFASSYRERAFSHLEEECRSLTRKSRGPERDAMLVALSDFGKTPDAERREVVLVKLRQIPGIDPSYRSLFGEHLREFQARLENPTILPRGVKSIFVVDKQEMGQFVDAKNRIVQSVKAYDVTADGELIISRELLSNWRRWEKSAPRRELLAVFDRVDERQTYLAQHEDKARVQADYTVMARDALRDDRMSNGLETIFGYPLLHRDRHLINQVADWNVHEHVAVIIDDSRDAALRRYYDTFRKELGQKANQLDDAETVRRVGKYIERTITYDLKADDIILKKEGKSNATTSNPACVFLGHYLISTGDRPRGVCRQMALFAGYLMTKLQQERLLSGQISVERNVRRDIRAGHEWARYDPPARGGIAPRFVDPAQHFRESAAELTRGRWPYLHAEDIALFAGTPIA